jgi:hypothetical protein
MGPVVVQKIARVVEDQPAVHDLDSLDYVRAVAPEDIHAGPDQATGEAAELDRGPAAHVRPPVVGADQKIGLPPRVGEDGLDVRQIGR